MQGKSASCVGKFLPDYSFAYNIIFHILKDLLEYTNIIIF